MNNISSPQTTDESIERILQNHLTAPRVTLADLQANIAGEVYFTAAQAADGANGVPPMEGFREKYASLECLTFCVLVLKNGFTVTGESACASPENFNAEIGRKIARQNAEQKIWPLMGYELKQRMGVAKAV